MAKTKKKIIESEEKFLSPDHLLGLEVGTRDIENAKLNMALEEQNLQNMLLTEVILKSRIEKQKQLLQSKAKEYEISKEKYQKLKVALFQEYNLDGDKFGYDTQTGLLIK